MKGALRFRLFCFPPVGAGASLFAPWRDALAPTVEVAAVQLPGRESRLREAPLDRLDHVVDAVYPEVSRADMPFALFGHSMGGLIAFELARTLRRRRAPVPAALFVSATRPPHLWRIGPPRHVLPRAAFRAMLRDMGGTPDDVLRSEELMALVEPRLRADFAVHDTYCYRPEPALECPLSVFGGAFDREVPEEELPAWQRHTARDVRIRIFQEGHFFLQPARRQIAHAILEDLSALPALEARQGTAAP